MLRMLRAGVCAAVVMFASAVGASSQGTADEAIAMVERAVELIQNVGFESARKAFETPGGEWHDRDLYIVIIDEDGVMKSHGLKPGLVGKNMLKLRDLDGKKFNYEFVAVKAGAPDWITYKWQNPSTKSIDQKSTYIMKEGRLLVGVGIYN